MAWESSRRRRTVTIAVTALASALDARSRALVGRLVPARSVLLVIPLAVVLGCGSDGNGGPAPAGPFDQPDAVEIAAANERRSELYQLARELLAAFETGDKAELWATAKQVRDNLGPISTQQANLVHTSTLMILVGIQTSEGGPERSESVKGPSVKDGASELLRESLGQ